MYGFVKDVTGSIASYNNCILPQIENSTNSITFSQTNVNLTPTEYEHDLTHFGFEGDYMINHFSTSPFNSEA